MQRILGVVAAAMLVSMNGAVAAAGSYDGGGERAAPLDIAALLTAANGAPPMICALAAQSVRGWGWNDWSDAPATPLGRVITRNRGESWNTPYAQADVDRLLEALASADPCVRELSVRLLGGQKTDAVSRGLMENGRALAPLTGMLRDNSALVREAAVVAVGHIDSSSSVQALMRVLQNDESPAVRRVAAWALGKKEAREAADVLSTTLGKESDARVREMIAWALGETEARSGTAALTAALRNDADDAVRETAAWALAEIGDRASVDALGAAAENDRSSRVRGTASWGIGQLHGNGIKAPPGLLRVLKDESADARLKAAWALGEVGDASALGAIRDALKAEQSGSVRKGLIRALIKSGGRSEETLTELLTSSDATVREAAVRGLAGNNSFNPWPWPWPWPWPRPRPFP